jgi:hypothetical protein
MPLIPVRPRFSWFALAAFVGAVLTAGEASACSAMSDAGACPAACGCCEVAEPAMRVPGNVVSATGGTLAVPGGEPSQMAPTGRCCCRSESPAAPEPKGQRTGEHRPDPDRELAAGWLDDGRSFRAYVGLIPPTASPPQKSPLYLRISRLLI